MLFDGPGRIMLRRTCMYCSGCLRRVGSAKLSYSLTDVAPVKSRLNNISRVLDATGTGNTNTTTRCLSKLAYQEDELYEKSHITFLHKPNAQGRPSPSTLVTSFSHKGFTLNLDSQVLGPMILLPQSILHWRVSDPTHITPASLRIFTLLHPKPDILVLGTGDHIVPLRQDCRELLKNANISVEVQRTETALATYNFLAVEERITVAAFCLVSNTLATTHTMSTESYDDYNEDFNVDTGAADVTKTEKEISEKIDQQTCSLEGQKTAEEIVATHLKTDTKEGQSYIEGENTSTKRAKIQIQADAKDKTNYGQDT